MELQLTLFLINVLLIEGTVRTHIDEVYPCER